ALMPSRGQAFALRRSATVLDAEVAPTAMTSGVSSERPARASLSPPTTQQARTVAIARGPLPEPPGAASVVVATSAGNVAAPARSTAVPDPEVVPPGVTSGVASERPARASLPRPPRQQDRTVAIARGPLLGKPGIARFIVTTRAGHAAAPARSATVDAEVAPPAMTSGVARERPARASLSPLTTQQAGTVAIARGPLLGKAGIARLILTTTARNVAAPARSTAVPDAKVAPTAMTSGVVSERPARASSMPPPTRQQARTVAIVRE